jgi:hypothetical protein
LDSAKIGFKDHQLLPVAALACSPEIGTPRVSQVFGGLNGERKRACEIVQFDTVGRQIKGVALYGAITS